MIDYFFFNDTATTEIYTLSLHDALPISAKAIYRAMGCRGLSRVDMFLKEDGQVVLNEVNTLPGMTSYSRYPRMMAAAGLPLAEVIDRMVSLTLTGKSR